MANYSITLAALVISLIIVIPMQAASSSSNDIVSTICQRTKNPSFCTNVLKSAGTTDLKALATFTLNVARTRATESHARAQALASKAADPKLKVRYGSCAENFDNAVGDINDAKNSLGCGDYNDVNIHASTAMTEVSDCYDNFPQLPPVDKLSDLMSSMNSKALEDVCGIVLVIANFLLLFGRV